MFDNQTLIETDVLFSQVSASFTTISNEMCNVFNEGKMKAFAYINSKAPSVSQFTSIADTINAFLPTVLLTIIKPTII